MPDSVEVKIFTKASPRSSQEQSGVTDVDEPAAYQLVGGVMAYQGCDGYRA